MVSLDYSSKKANALIHSSDGLRESNRNSLETRGVTAGRLHGVKGEFECGFVDVAFTFDGVQFIGEIKVTTTLPLPHAFRFALGQLLEYSPLKIQITSAVDYFS
jgi:hypothetical protein